MICTTKKETGGFIAIPTCPLHIPIQATLHLLLTWPGSILPVLNQRTAFFLLFARRSHRHFVHALKVGFTTLGGRSSTISIYVGQDRGFVSRRTGVCKS